MVIRFTSSTSATTAVLLLLLASVLFVLSPLFSVQFYFGLLLR